MSARSDPQISPSTSDFFSTIRMRRGSVRSTSKEKGKDPVRGDSLTVSSSFDIIDKDPFAAHYSGNGSSSSASCAPTRPSTADAAVPSTPKKPRTSLLVAASDALNWKFGRRRPSIRQPPMPVILPNVIEITAQRPDAELEERNRLREEAAHAIGLVPLKIPDEPQPRDESTDEDENEVDENDAYTPTTAPNRHLGEARNSGSSPNILGRSPQGSSLSVSGLTTPMVGRLRSGSMMTHSRTSSANLSPIPSFPALLSTLTPFRQSAALLPKYYPASSLRIFALSKNWKNRYMVLSSPMHLLSLNTVPAVSYLHLFKSSDDDEREMERLEINEDSVVFVADEEVGGRRHVIKVGGIDVGALRKDLNHEESGRTMWFLQIPDPAEAQRWIAVIKNAIFGQRTVRAGLGLPHSLGNLEPRGDLDVMLSIRASGIITSPTANGLRTPHSVTAPSAPQNENTYASSVSSQSVQSQTTAPKSLTSGPVSALKGLFSNSTRPRSVSRAASLDSEHDREQTEESFTSIGSNLLNMMRSSTPDHSGQTVSRSSHIFAPPSNGDNPIDRRIINDRQPLHWMTNDPSTVNKDRVNRTLSLGAFSLHPPPRKRWTSIGPNESQAYNQMNGNTIPIEEDVNLRSSLDKTESEPPTTPIGLASFSFGTPEQRPRAPSLQSVSTFASGENAQSTERSSSSTKRSSKRWSRHGGFVNRLTPPNGRQQSDHSSTRVHLHPYAAERSSSRTSSTHSLTSQKSVLSGLPTFSKRASASSAFSVSSSSTSHSFQGSVNSVSGSSHRISIPPPPRPAPTSALPPAPDQELAPPMESIGSNKSSFRNSVTQRAFRLSMIAPKPPPSSVLPPRPDEPPYKAHRKSSSSSRGGSGTHVPQLESIPASPTPAPVPASVSPFPEPLGPLPPTPMTNLPPPSTTPSRAQSMSIRRASLKGRLRILSSPSPSGSPSASRSSSPQPQRPATMFVPAHSPTNSYSAISPPTTPIAEKITMFQNDPSFLQINTPTMPSLPPPRSLHMPVTPPEHEYAEHTSLSPPPRRGSKQITLLETELESSSPSDEKQYTDSDPPRLLSLSRPGSVISLGIVSM